MQESQEVDKLEEALEKFQETSGFVKATKENPYHKNKYANYNTVVAGTRQDLRKHGLRVKQAVTNLDGKAAIFTRLKHAESGQYIQTIAPLSFKDGDPQAQGSAITYMKRYTYVAILDLLVDTDDDGNLANDIGPVADKKKEAAEFYAEKAKMIKAYRTKGVDLQEIGKVVQKVLNKPKVETIADVEAMTIAMETEPWK